MVKYRASFGARFCMIDREPVLLGSSNPVMRKEHAAEAVVFSSKIQESGKQFPEGSRLNQNVQQQSGSLGKTGKVPVTYAKGWTPS